MVCREILEILKVYDAGKYFWNPAKLENIRVPFGIVFGVPASPSKKRMENERTILAYGPSTRVRAVGTCVCREILETQEIYDAGQYF